MLVTAMPGASAAAESTVELELKPDEPDTTVRPAATLEYGYLDRKALQWLQDRRVGEWPTRGLLQVVEPETRCKIAMLQLATRSVLGGVLNEHFSRPSAHNLDFAASFSVDPNGPQLESLWGDTPLRIFLHYVLGSWKMRKLHLMLAWVFVFNTLLEVLLLNSAVCCALSTDCLTVSTDCLTVSACCAL